MRKLAILIFQTLDGVSLSRSPLKNNMLSFLTATLLSACGGGSGDTQTTTPQPSGQAQDTQAPSVPRDLTAGNVSSVSVSFSWSPSEDDTWVSGYSVFKDTILIATVADTTYSDDNLSAGTQYSYSVSALDAAGNESDQSQPLHITTSPEMVCQVGEQRQVSCADQIENAAEAHQTLSCTADGSGFEAAGACQVSACKSGYGIQGNACVAIGGGNIPAFWENVPRSACDIAINDAGKSCDSEGIACPTTTADIQSAIDAAQPGDAICIRGAAGGGPAEGIYACTGEPCLNISPATNGDIDVRITLAAYPGESVTLRGKGEASVWNGNTTGLTNGQGQNQVGITVSGDYWDIQGFRMEWFGETWLSIRGDNVRVRDMDLQYAFRFGVELGAGDATSDDGDVNDVEVSYNRVRNVYHHAGIYILSGSGDNINYVNRPVVKYNMVADNGYENTGAKVPPVPGDQAGGGNADGIIIEHVCSNQGQQYCFDGLVKYNVVINPADDCIDNAGENFTFLGNILVACGPEGNKGIKLFSAEADIKLVGNFALQDNSGMSTGFELRNTSGLTVINNMSLYSADKGFDGLDSSFISANNVSAFSSSQEFKRYSALSQSDWDGDSNGDPLLEADCTADFIYDYASYMNASMGALERLYGVYSQFAAACQPAAGSPLLDSGEIIAGLHCATADDDTQTPQNLSDVSCLHWLGDKPDRGSFERGFW